MRVNLWNINFPMRVKKFPNAALTIDYVQFELLLQNLIFIQVKEKKLSEQYFISKSWLTLIWNDSSGLKNSVDMRAVFKLLWSYNGDWNKAFMPSDRHST